MSKNQPIFLLIDGHAVIYRAFYAFPKQLTDPTGRLINAVFGFSRIILTAIRSFEPEFMAVTFDHPKPTFRHQKYAAYKAQRPEMPDELKPQIEIIKQITQALNIPQYEIEGYEADDLIGTISKKIDEVSKKYLSIQSAKNKSLSKNQAAHQQKDQAAHQLMSQVLTIIVTGDQDTFQLVDHNTHVWLPGRGKYQQDKEYDAQAVKEKIGVHPDQVPDLKALMGDSSDNIPGVKGIGPKTASQLIQQFGNIEALYQTIDNTDASVDQEKIPSTKISSKKTTPKKVQAAALKPALLAKLIQFKEDAFLSKKLAVIENQVPINFDLEACRVSSYDKEKAIKIFKELDFRSLISLLPEDEFERQVQETLF